MQNIKEYVAEKKILLKEEIAQLEKTPKLAVIQVGNNQASNAYVKGKIKDCAEVGIEYEHCLLDEDITQEELNKEIIRLNEDVSVSGVIVQLPVPDGLVVDLNLISPDKDIDGFRIDSKFIPCTPLGIMNYLKDNDVVFDGKNAVVIGRSDIVGKPIAGLLQDENCTVTICHSHTKDISFYTKNADIIIVATGHRHTLTPDMIGDNSPIVIDVGINRNEDNKLCGDCDYNDIVDVCGFVSPVPGGVGLLTRLALLTNLKNA